MLRRSAMVRAALAAVALVVLAPLTACDPAPPESVTLRGHGFGHGRGMGQWGALGYAVDHGWSGTQILDHYYGGTTSQTAPAAGDQRVYLTESKGRELVVTQTAGRLRVDGYDSDVAAVRIARLGAGRFRIYRGTGCTGPWTLVGDRTSSEVSVRSSVLQGNDPTRMMQHCVSGQTLYYRGSMRAVDALGTIVAVNQVAIEAMLRSIIPKEVSPSWADAGGGRGGSAVRAQAVAARSYALAGDGRWGTWATTCDSSTCQAYAGYGRRTTGSSTIVRNEDLRTDVAVSATTGVVRTFASGRIARTEFATSSGGWTSPGDFPAVVDDGDDYAGNSHHSWSVVLTRARIESAFDARQGRDMGTFLGFDSWVRNGLGDMGGRVTSMRARFSDGDVILTGEQVRILFSLKSNWFG